MRFTKEELFIIGALKKNIAGNAERGDVITLIKEIIPFLDYSHDVAAYEKLKVKLEDCSDEQFGSLDLSKADPPEVPDVDLDEDDIEEIEE